MTEQEFDNWQRLWELLCGCAIGQAIHVAVGLGIPEILAVRPLSAEEIAASTKSDLWSLEAVLRCLTAFDIVGIGADGRFALTSLGRCLMRSSAGSFADQGGVFFDSIYGPLGALLDMVRTGKTAFDQVYGLNFYEYLARNPALEASFYKIMTGSAAARYAALSTVYDFSTVGRIVDVGAGDGSLLVQILREHPAMRGVLFDVAAAIDRGRERVAEANFSGRCELVVGDFFDKVPSGGDLYVLAQILNNWRDDDARGILQNCRTAMGEQGRLLVLEPVHIPNAPIVRSRALISLAVMAQRGGRTRSEVELASLFQSAGLRLDSIHPVPSSTTYAIAVSPMRITASRAPLPAIPRGDPAYRS